MLEQVSVCPCVIMTSMEPDSALYAAWPGRATQIDMLWSYFVASDATRSSRVEPVADPVNTGWI